ncbi:ABC transporter substrate-binding protein [Acetobacterium carbinolicum]|jgi:branched-chain amino acid transport system substrate-binding protein|uniref:ABC transporter substrate-binding protein n=1 Tax=Acetobacterium TaxID=33951 RepID=UPI000DBECD93|nr:MULTISPECIES: ABC transporter substrate-binding protein [unclassified Acetobacterium]AWW25286.1 branched-chain amino acid ABC transporter substrate-binding protein [Acetobacterium sp. KB-1]MDK2941813.1 branched-chain amino acid transport system substrate-binding protein [Acetobacterium sp.]MDZ5723789.1 ABC transporter substrate-binding protein [Acetobacterium sp. K1/6]
MKKTLSVLLSLALVVTMAAGCSGGTTTSSEDSDVIKIGVFEPLTGANAAGGELEVEGVELANQLRPEVLGKKVELVIADNKSDKAEATTAAARLIEKDKVVAILGSWGSSLSIAAGDVVKTNQIPAVALSATNPQVTAGNDYYFRVCFLDPFQGTVMANYAYKNLNAKKVAIIQEVSNDYSVGLAKFFTDSFVQLSGDPNAIVATGNYNTNDQDFNGILTNIKASNPDVIFAPGNFTESALIIKQARALGITAPFIGGDTWETNEFITVGGADVEGAVMSTFFDDTNPLTEAGKTFVAEYKKTYPDRDNIAAVTALGYDGYMMTLDAIERAGSADPVAIRDALAKTADFEGATGMITIDENGDATKNEAIIKTVKDGIFTYLDSVTID